jgi:hypothetical protein
MSLLFERILPRLAGFAVWVLVVAAILLAGYWLTAELTLYWRGEEAGEQARLGLLEARESAAADGGLGPAPALLNRPFESLDREAVIEELDREIETVDAQVKELEADLPWPITFWRWTERGTMSARISALAAYRDSLVSMRDTLVRIDDQRLFARVMHFVEVAFWLVAGALLVKLFIRVAWWVMAGYLAGRIRPVAIESPGPNSPAWPPVRHGTALELGIAPGRQFLVRPRHASLSLPTETRRDTSLLFSRQSPLTCLVSGLGLMTRIRPGGPHGASVTLSPSGDPLVEFAAVEIPAGAAMVVFPRNLVGAVSAEGRPPIMRQHWRINRLGAWLTMQLRFVSVAGPCTIVMKGRRGVVVEEPGEPTGLRMSDQANTIGFSTTVTYSVVRSDTFIAYIRGVESLFNDSFGGGPGYSLREIVPSPGASRGPTGALEGTMDVCLKVLGI